MAIKKDGLFRRKKTKQNTAPENSVKPNEAGDNPSAKGEINTDAPGAGKGSDAPADQIPDILLQDQPKPESADKVKEQTQPEAENETPENSVKNAPTDAQAEPFSFRFDENGITVDDESKKKDDEKNDKGKVQKPNRKKKFIIGGVIAAVLLIAFIIAVVSAVTSLSSSVKEVKANPLKRGNVESLVNADGTVVSTKTGAVSNSSGMRITEVYVSVGDYVNEGDALCHLESSGSAQNSDMLAAYGGDASAASAPTSETVTANTDGVITSVKAEVGGAASGDLFSIQNTDSLMIEMAVNETDINKVGIGMPVRITSEGAANRQYSGTVASVAPTSSETATVSSGSAGAGYSGLTGAAAGSSTPTYKVNVNLNLPTDGLRIGMKTNQDIIIENHKDVFVVSYDALVKSGDNSYQIYVAEEENGIKTVKAIPVSLGLQGDANVEVISDQLKENMSVIQETDKVAEGDKVIITDKSTTSNGTN